MLGQALLKMRHRARRTRTHPGDEGEGAHGRGGTAEEEVERQSRKVVELYKNVTDSIRYAKRLQESILPPGSASGTLARQLRALSAEGHRQQCFRATGWTR